MIKLGNKKLCESCFAETASEKCAFCGYDKHTAVADPTVLPCGSILMGRYIVGRVIGKGGFGITYLAYDSKMEKVIAIKEFYPFGLAIRTTGNPTVSVTNSEAASVFKNGAEKFYNEAKLVSKFNGNPNIVSVYEFFYENDTVYFTMEYLRGETLKSYVNNHGKLTPGQAVFVADAVSNALMAAHSSKVLHRDISPDNIMLCNDGTVKLLDFGAARQVMAEKSQSLSVILKPGFAPLEQYQKKGKQGPWTDIYSLGASLYYAMTLDTLEDPMTRMEEDSDFLSNFHNIDENLWSVIEKATMLRIADRYADIFEFRKGLESTQIEAVQIVDTVESLSSSHVLRTAQPIDASTITISPQNITASSLTANGYAEKSKKKTDLPVKLIIGIIIAVALIAGIIAAAALFGEKEDNKTYGGSGGGSPVISENINPIPGSKEKDTTTTATAPASDTRFIINDPDNYLTSSNEDTLTRYALDIVYNFDCNVLVSVQYIGVSAISEDTIPDSVYYDYFPKKTDGIAVIFFENDNTTYYKIYSYGSCFSKYTDKLAAIETEAKNKKSKCMPYFKTALLDICDIEDYEITQTVTAATQTTKKEKTTEETTTTAKSSATTAKETTTKSATTPTKATNTAPTEVKIGGKTYSVKLTSLELNGLGLKDKDIANLQYMKNLTYLNLCDNKLTDVSVLGNLKKLQNVQLHNNNISDISFVKNLDKLNCLAANNNKIKDLSPLKGKKKITQLWLDDNPISDLSPISGLTNLTAVGFTRCPIKKLDAFAKLTKLETICLEGSGVSDISGLKKCTKLRYVYLGRCKVTDVSALKGSKGISELYLDNNPIDEDSIQTFKGITMRKGGYLCLINTKLDSDDQINRICELVKCSGSYKIAIFVDQIYEV